MVTFSWKLLENSYRQTTSTAILASMVSVNLFFITQPALSGTVIGFVISDLAMSSAFSTPSACGVSVFFK